MSGMILPFRRLEIYLFLATVIPCFDENPTSFNGHMEKHNDPGPLKSPHLRLPQTPQPLFQPIIFLTTKTANETFEAKMEPQYQAPEISLPKKNDSKIGSAKGETADHSGKVSIMLRHPI